MPLISSAELSLMQADVAATAFDTSITIKRPAHTNDGTGHDVGALSTIATVSGTVSQPPAELMQNYSYLIGSQDAWQIRLPVGTNVRENDMLTVGGTSNMKVQVVLQPRARQTNLHLLAAKVQ